ncbi:hypothetical protein Q428_09980 [Fervidicella metallireducens AeB]|uniref:Uncharacterized protein n=1 Tax=Fervidicella metallireducens AeB TaxID=1403537 RepID=A0A017RU19_9CLOT|nr:hypothetical protein Q428_09980 [Fervidicella metallireducens AeB]
MYTVHISRKMCNKVYLNYRDGDKNEQYRAFRRCTNGNLTREDMGYIRSFIPKDFHFHVYD